VVPHIDIAKTRLDKRPIDCLKPSALLGPRTAGEVLVMEITAELEDVRE